MAATSKAQKLLKISRFLFQSICGALFFTRLARTFSLASAAVGLRLSPLSSNGSFFSMSPSCGEKGEKVSPPAASPDATMSRAAFHPPQPQDRHFLQRQTRGVGFFGAEGQSHALPPHVPGFTGSGTISVATQLITPSHFSSLPEERGCGSWKGNSSNAEAGARGKSSCSAWTMKTSPWWGQKAGRASELMGRGCSKDTPLLACPAPLCSQTPVGRQGVWEVAVPVHVPSSATVSCWSRQDLLWELLNPASLSA